MDLAAIGGTLAAVITGGTAVAGGAWAWWQKHQRESAQTRADVAESNADRTVADAQQTVYKLLVDRLGAVEKEQQSMRLELSAEREHSRVLTMRIWELEGLMHKAGITIPPFTPAKSA